MVKLYRRSRIEERTARPSWLKTKTEKASSLVVPLSPARNAPIRVEDMQRDG